MNDSYFEKNIFTIFFTILSLLVISFVLIISCSACTVSFQNVSTNGKSSDVIDEEQTASPDVTSDLSIPVSLTK